MMERKLSILAIYLVLLLFSGSCSTGKLRVESTKPSASLSDYKTFDFFELEAAGDTSSSFHENIAYFKSEVARQLNARGLTQTANQPELKINLGIVVEEKTQTRQTSLSDPGEWTYVGQRNYKWESKTVEVGKYKEGSLTIHLVDNATNEAIWVGSMAGVVPRQQAKRETAIHKAVIALFEEIEKQ
ncbi:MAG TPA: DUF4136 domain-containing protein [Cyclobacteriaceae bacterium]|nr:DUF4136 domain-containing protein [Cyclobacteriaceae bacterium]